MKTMKTKSSPAIERILKQLRRKGCRFPISRRDLFIKYGGVAGEATFRELVRRKLILCSEAWDGSLSELTAGMLEEFGVTGRADFRRRYLTGKLSTDHWQCFGKFKRAQLMAWAGLPPPDEVLHEVRLYLDTETFRKLDVLVKANRFRGPDRREKLMARMLRMEWAWQHCPIRKKLRRRSKHKRPQSLE